MRTLEAKVLDPTHLELSEPIPFGSGQHVQISLDARQNDRPGAARLKTATEEPPSKAPGLSPPRRHSELAWRQSHEDHLQAYVGQWVVLEGEEIVAHGEDPTQVIEQATRAGIDTPYIFYVEDVAADIVQMGL